MRTRLSVWLVIASLIAVAWLMGRRPGPGTIVSPLIEGFVLVLQSGAEPPHTLLLVLVIHVAVFGE